MSINYPPPKEKGISKEIILLIIGAFTSGIFSTLIPIFFHQIPLQSSLVINAEQQKDVLNSIILTMSNDGDTVAKNIKIQLDVPIRIISVNQNKSLFENISFNKTNNMLKINIDNLYGHRKINPIDLIFDPTNENILDELKIYGTYDGGSIFYKFKEDLPLMSKIYILILSGIISSLLISYIFYDKNKQNRIKIYQLESSAKYYLSFLFAEYMKTERNIDDKIDCIISLIDFLIFALDNKVYTKEIFHTIDEKINTYLQFILHDNIDLLNFPLKVDHINTIYKKISAMENVIPIELRNSIFEKVAEISKKTQNI